MNKKINVKKRLYDKCVKEWEDNGWEWHNEEDDLMIVLIKRGFNNVYFDTITLDKVDHKYFAQSHSTATGTSFYAISQQEHKRLTKTFKALRW